MHRASPFMVRALAVALVACSGALPLATSAGGGDLAAQTPSPADNPPAPVGYKLMAQVQVTPEMTAWAVAILHDPATYPMFAATTRVFGTLTVLARVEWYPPDLQSAVVHREVTLYVPA